MRLLIMRWFGIYAAFVILGDLIAWWAWGPAAAGFGVLLGQSLYAAIYIYGAEFNEGFRDWLLGSWR